MCVNGLNIVFHNLLHTLVYIIDQVSLQVNGLQDTGNHEQYWNYYQRPILLIDISFSLQSDFCCSGLAKLTCTTFELAGQIANDNLIGPKPRESSASRLFRSVKLTTSKRLRHLTCTF